MKEELNRQESVWTENQADELPEGWAWATLERMIGPDGVFSDGDWVESKDQDPNGDVRLIQLADVGDGVYRDRSNRFLTTAKAHELGCTFLEPGDVLIARMPDPLGRACIFPGDRKRCVTVVDVCIVRTGKQGVVHRWLMHFVNSPQSRTEIAGYQSGSTRKRISRGNLARIEYPVPPLAEQNRIVDIVETQFTRLDAAVTALERAQANLERYRASVLQAACDGRLVPTEAELARREGRDYEPADELLERILEERRAKWEEERWEYEIERAKKKAAQAERKAAGLPYYIRELEPEHWEHRTPEEYEPYLPKGDKWKEKYDEPASLDTPDLPELPDGWVWTTLGSVVSVRNGYAFRSKDYQDEGVLLVRQSNLGGDGITLTRSEYLPEEYLREYSDYTVHKGDILIGMSGSVGKTCVYDLDSPGLQNQRTGLLEFHGSIHKLYVRYFLDTLTSELLSQAKGVAVQNISANQIQGFSLPLPPLAEQRRIVDEIQRRFSVIDELMKSVEVDLVRARRLRQAVLKKAFEGRLVPQDPSDEPASALLERIRNDSGTGENETPKQMALL